MLHFPAFLFLTRAALLLCVFLAACGGAAAGDTPDTESRDTLPARAAALLKLPAEKQRKQIDALLEEARQHSGPEADLTLLRLLNGKAEITSRKVKQAALAEAAARIPEAEYAALDPERAYEAARALRLLGGMEGEAGTPRLQKVVEAWGGTEARRVRFQVYLTHADLAGREKDAGRQAARRREILADIRNDPEADYFASVAARILNSLANAAADPAEALAVRKEIFRDYGRSNHPEVILQVLYAKKKTADASEPELRRRLQLMMVDEYKNSPSSRVRNSLNSVISSLIESASDMPDPRSALDDLAVRLENSRSAGRIRSVVLARAGLEEDPELRAAALADYIRTYRASTRKRVREDVLKAAELLLAASDGSEEALELADSLAEEYTGSRDQDTDHAVSGLLLAAIKAGGGTEAVMRRIDVFLSLAVQKRVLPYHTIQVQKIQGELQGDSRVTEKYYDDRLAAAENDEEWCRIIDLKASAVSSNTRALTETVTAFLERHGDTRDPETGEALLRVIGRLRYDTDPEIVKPMYQRVAAAFGDADDPAGRKIKASALSQLLRLTRDREEKKALAEKMIALTAEGGSGMQQYEEQAYKAQAEALNRPRIIREYYRRQEESAAEPAAKAENLLKLAAELPAPGEKASLYRQVLDLAGEQPSGAMRKHAAAALTGLAETARNPQDRDGFYRRAAEMLLAASKPDEWEVHKIYRAMAEKMTGKDNLIRLHDEEAAVYARFGKRRGWVAEAMMKKLPHLGSPAEQTALLDEVIAMLADESDANELNTALLKKAELVQDADENTALYDRVIALAGKPREGYFSFSAAKHMTDAVTGKAAVTGDPGLLRRFIDSTLKQPLDSSDLRLAIDLAEKIEGKQEKIAAYDAIIAFYKDSEDSSIVSSVNFAELKRAREAGDSDAEEAAREKAAPGFRRFSDGSSPDSFFEKQKKHDAFLEEIKALTDPAERVRRLDVWLEETGESYNSHRAVDVLFLKAENVPSADGKKVLYQEILDRALYTERSIFSYNWKAAEKACRAIASLLESDPERLAYYTEVLDQYAAHSGSGSGEFLTAIRRERLPLLGSRGAQLAEVKQIILDILHSGSYGMDRQLREAVEKFQEISGTGTETEEAEFLFLFEPAGNKIEWMRQALDQAAVLEPAARREMLMEVSERCLSDPDKTVFWTAMQLRLQAAALTDGREKKLRILDELLETVRLRADRVDIARILEEKAALASDTEEKIGLHTEIIELLSLPESGPERRELCRAMIAKADLLEDGAAQAALYAAAQEILALEKDPLGRRLYEEAGQRLGSLPPAGR